MLEFNKRQKWEKQEGSKSFFVEGWIVQDKKKKTDNVNATDSQVCIL